jgi:hemolysin activation/secretion protein
VDGNGTRLGLGFVRSDYELGKQFAALGATGVAEVATFSLTQPLVRSRTRNLVAAFAIERKDLKDHTTTPLNDANRRVDAVHGGVHGNYIDDLGVNSYNSYGLTVTRGRLTMDDASLALDQGAKGVHTHGVFWKANYEYQRAMFFSAASRLTASVQGQVANRNLTSAEKFSLGGPTGVRGYPVGEALGDGGLIATVEYRQQLAQADANTPVFGSVFYDWGHVKYNQRALAFPTPGSESLSSIGVGLSAGVYGDFLFSAQFAWRTDATHPASDPDRKPRFWFSVQKWL